MWWTEPDMPEAWERWVRATGLHRFVADHAWVWPMSETLHYLGLSLLLGTVGMFDLRVLGMAKKIPPAALHKLIPIGISLCRAAGGIFLAMPSTRKSNMPTVPSSSDRPR